MAMNTTPKRLLGAGLWLVVAALSAAAPLPAGAQGAQIDLPDLGDPTENALPLAREKELGERIMRQIRARRVIVDDLIVQEYIDALGYQLLEHAEDAPLHDFEFFVIRDKAINAFALPGGYIGLNAGLITSTDHEGELAAVMAHEISHVTQRHLARAFAKQGDMALPIMAGIITAVLLGGGEAAEAAIVATTAGASQAQINYTRKHEHEADRIGIDLLGRAGFDADSMATLFEKMQRQARLHGGPLPEYLSTHPVHGSRIAEARDRADRYPPAKPTDAMQYRLLKARLRVLLGDNPHQAADNLARSLSDQAPSADARSTRYGLVIALLESGRLDEAARQADTLVKNAPANRYFALLAAEVDLRRGLDGAALQKVAALRRAHPDNHVVTMTHARMLIEAERADEALRELQDYSAYRQGDPAVYALLSRAAVSAGADAQSHEYIAQYHRISGDLDKAVFHLEAALKGADTEDRYRQARLQAQLDELRDKQKDAARRENAAR